METITDPGTIAAVAAVVGMLIVMDIAAGILSAASRGDIDSSTLRHGLLHKLALVMAMALAVALEVAEGVIAVGAAVPLVIPVATYISLMEACSIYENCRTVNPDLQIKEFDDLFRFSGQDEGNVPSHDDKGES